MSGFGKSLRLPKTLPVGAGEKQKQAIKQHWDTMGPIEEDIRQKGLLDMAKPVHAYVELTADILTSPDSQQYTETYVRLLSWYSYVSELLARVQALILQYQNMVDVVASEFRQTQRSLPQSSEKKKGPTKEELSDLLVQNPEYQEVLHELQKYQQSRVILSAKLDAIERSLKLISRQVEIRRLDIEQHRTSGSMPSRNLRNPFSRSE